MDFLIFLFLNLDKKKSERKAKFYLERILLERGE